jgi:hypothetical protein
LFKIKIFHILESGIWNTENPMLQSFDVLLSLKLAVSTDRYIQSELANQLDVSPSQVNRGIKSCMRSGLIDEFSRNVVRPALEEFVIHGVKYAFPGELGSVTRGMPTAHSAPPFATKMGPSTTVYVWPLATGEARGESVKPIYKTAPFAANKDHKLYEALALLDAIRIGRAREKNLATKAIATLIRKSDG